MAKPTTTRTYGKASRRPPTARVFAELPQSPVRRNSSENVDNEDVAGLAKHVSTINLEDTPKLVRRFPRKSTKPIELGSVLVVGEKTVLNVQGTKPDSTEDEGSCPRALDEATVCTREATFPELSDSSTSTPSLEVEPLRILGWDEVCSSDDRMDKIAEASYAEVYRVTNERGISIIKVIRMTSPIKPQTKAQVRSGLVDEEPHTEEDVQGELQISEWLADIPGFVIYKERYIVQGKASRQLLETHQNFQKKVKRQDPDRLQFYPSPSRYLDDTRFLVVELGDAGKALEDWELTSTSQLWDVFFLEAIALARAEDHAMFEHRDLHEGNLCLKQANPPREPDPKLGGQVGYSGLEITILDYGLSRAEDLSIDFAEPLAYDLEKDLSLFTSTHATQCKVYRQMRSFLLTGDRTLLPASSHTTPYANSANGPLSWKVYAPYTNVLWLAYLYEYLIQHFKGDSKHLSHFKKETKEMWMYLNPTAKSNIPCFGSAADVVSFGWQAGWVREDQLVEMGASILDRGDSIILSKEDATIGPTTRSSPRRRNP